MSTFSRQLILNNRVEELALLADYVDSIAEECGIDPSLAMSLNLALEEAVTNVVCYAYPEGTPGTVTILSEVADHQITFTIDDTGIPFDPTQKEDADITLSLEERPIGGLGIFLVKQLMDSVSYQRVDGHNILKMYKKF
jgi:anti-sigma regulatory factor (Ser/Thr protein kinase)